MSEVGRQLVANERARQAVLEQYRQAQGELMACTMRHDDEGVAGIDLVRAQRCLDRIGDAKHKLVALREERATLVATER